MSDYAQLVQQHRANPYHEQIKAYIQQQIAAVNKNAVDAKYQQFLVEIQNKAKINNDDINNPYQLDNLVHKLYRNAKDFFQPYFAANFLNYNAISSYGPYDGLSKIDNIIDKYLTKGKSIYDYVQDNINITDTSFTTLYHNLQYYSLIVPNIFEQVNQMITSNNYTFFYFTWVNPALPAVQALFGKTDLNMANFETGASFLAWPLQEQFLNNIQQELVDSDNLHHEFREYGYQGIEEMQMRNVSNIESIFKKSYHEPNMAVNTSQDRRQVMSNINLNTTGGWPKHKLRQAIVSSGLLVPRTGKGNSGTKQVNISGDQFRNRLSAQQDMSPQALARLEQILGVKLADITDITINYKSSGSLSTAIPIPQDIDDVDLKTTGLPWRAIGIDKNGFAPLNVNMSQKYFEAIYRRIYGTIYTVDWQQLCQSQQINIVKLDTLKFIIDTYFNPGQPYQLTNHQQACQIIAQFLPQLQAAINSVQGQPQNWIRFITDRYNKSMVQQQQKRAGDGDGAGESHQTKRKM